MQKLLFLLITVSAASSFLLPKAVRINTIRYASAATAEESAQVLTDFMAKAHEEKLRAMNDVEQKFKNKIQELEEKLATYESDKSMNDVDDSAPLPIQNGSNTFHFPATNKALAEKIAAYQEFLSRYVVQSQIEKVNAVAHAEKKIKDKYEEIIADMKSGAKFS